MAPIDLTNYAQAGKKIPTHFLKHSPAEVKQINLYKVFYAHALDFAAVAGLVSIICVLLHTSMNAYVITSGLRTVYAKLPLVEFATNALPLMMMSYYFFSYFFNQGQSWGLSKVKARIEMPELSFRTSLLWAIYSSAALMTCGLSLTASNWMNTKGWGKFQTHDYLYFELMEERELAPVNLIDLTKQHKEELKPFNENDYARAA